MLADLKSQISNPNPKIILVVLCWLALALRLGPAFNNRFHPDEALFSSWALKVAHGENVLLSSVPIDKPPLLIYLTAISFFFIGQTEIAARVINIAASVISVVLVYHVAKIQLGAGQRVTGQLATGQLVTDRPVDPSTNRSVDLWALLPPLLLALSPFAILFAPTAFLDPTMIMFGLASLVAASRGRTGWAGILLGLSFAAKVQGLFFAPLILIYGSTGQSVNRPIGQRVDRSSCHAKHVTLTPYLRFILGLASIAGFVLLWDRMRGGVPFWIQQTINYGGIRMIYPSEVWPRWDGWLSFLPYFFGPIAGIMGFIGLPILLYFDLTRYARTRAALIDLALLAYLIALFAVHWLLAFPVWDRYFLILVPIAALLGGRSISQWVNGSIRRFVTLLPCHLVTWSLILVTTLPYSLNAAQSQYPIGGDHGAYDGIEHVAAYLSALPSGTVVYDHWLAWELDYYLGEGHVYLKYFDTPADFAEDLRVFGSNGERYVVFPARESPAKIIDAIGQVGYTLSPVFETPNRFGQTSLTIYRIVKRDE